MSASRGVNQLVQCRPNAQTRAEIKIRPAASTWASPRLAAPAGRVGQFSAADLWPITKPCLDDDFGYRCHHLSARLRASVAPGARSARPCLPLHREAWPSSTAGCPRNAKPRPVATTWVALRSCQFKNPGPLGTSGTAFKGPDWFSGSRRSSAGACTASPSQTSSRWGRARP